MKIANLETFQYGQPPYFTIRSQILLLVSLIRTVPNRAQLPMVRSLLKIPVFLGGLWSLAGFPHTPHTTHPGHLPFKGTTINRTNASLSAPSSTQNKRWRSLFASSTITNTNQSSGTVAAPPCYFFYIDQYFFSECSPSAR